MSLPARPSVATAALRIAGVLLLLAAFPPAARADLLLHAAAPLALPTYEGSGQVVEPDVIWIPGGWRGYAYWMVMTPYPCGDETRENPSILASQNGVTWEVPVRNGVRAPAPLVDNPESCARYAYSNNDPTIAFAGDSLFIYYMTTCWSGARAGTTDVRRIASGDGVHWTPPASIPTMWTKDNYVLSPSVVYHDGLFHMWYVEMGGCGVTDVSLRMRTSADGITWRAEDDRAVIFDRGPGLPYHVTVKRQGGAFAMVYVAFPAGAGCGAARNLYYAESADGTDWHALPDPLLSPNPVHGTWDDGGIYRSTFMGRYPNLAVWYSAQGDTTCSACGGRVRGPVWHVGRTLLGSDAALALLPQPPPGETRLDPAWPNPFRADTRIRFELADPTPTEVAVFDLAGRRVTTLVRSTLGAGGHEIEWDGRDAYGRRVPPGVFIVRMKGEGIATRVQRLVVMP